MIAEVEHVGGIKERKKGERPYLRGSVALGAQQ